MRGSGWLEPVKSLVSIMRNHRLDVDDGEAVVGLRCGSKVLALAVGAVLLLPGVACAATDDDYKAEYASIYAGSLNDQDAMEVAHCLDSWGWSRRILGTSLLNQVRWWSVVGEDPAHPGEYSDDADFLYYSTHGASNDDPATTRQRTLIYLNGNVIDRLYADQADSPGDPAITADGWRVTGLQTASRWDNDLEWVVLAACNQLEYWASAEDGAHEYARAMLGYPRRMHSIWGYHEWAPEAPLYSDGQYRDTKIALDFLVSQSVATGYDAIDWAWENANEAYDIDQWSGVRHSLHYGETIWRPRYGSDGSTVDPDTSPWTYPDIEFVYTTAYYSRDVL